MNTIEGLLVVDKDLGMTSFDVIRRLRKLLNVRAIGHTGTLDPLATGVLCVCIGWSVKLIRFLCDDRKVYRAVARLGQTTTTDDREGAVLESRPVDVSREDVEGALAKIAEQTTQVPPVYSAIKRQGRRAYTAARAGEEVTLEPRPVRIDELVLEEYRDGEATFLVRCGKGTFVRSICRDLGEQLGCGGHLAGLRRLESGEYGLSRALTLGALEGLLRRREEVPLVGCMEMLGGLPLVAVTGEEGRRLVCGQRIDVGGRGEPGLVRIAMGVDGPLLAVGEVDGRGVLRPVRVRPSI